jgi:class 3 adenylate cyclase
MAIRLAGDEDPRLSEIIETLEAAGWAALVADAERTLLWVSDELQAFLGETDPVRLGIGRHMVEALLSESWLKTIDPASAVRLVQRAVPYLVNDLPGGVAALGARLGEPFASLLAGIEPMPEPDIWHGRFGYVESGLDPYDVDFVVTRFRDASTGAPIGSCAITYMALRPTLVSLLARGDADMYERMSQLVEPARHQAAILFADLQASGDLSRQLPTARYFQLIRDLTTQFDRAVAANVGVVGKHAGDGMTAFFIAESRPPADVALSALHTARQLQKTAEVLAADAGVPVVLNMGLHWGSNLFMGQLVPGGRLDVTALGDEVNECARIQEATREGGITVSKAFAELLEPRWSLELGVDPDALRYQPLSRLPGATEKGIRDAGTLAVALLS